MENTQYPPAIKQLKNVLSSAKDVVVGAFENKSVFASDNTQKNRTEICKQCEFYVAEDDRCKICGCYISNKVKFSETFCPIMKWDKESNSPGTT
jgi:hypothetical protein